MVVAENFNIIMLFEIFNNCVNIEKLNVMDKQYIGF